jgi:shikimate dehydrogenase
MYVYGLIGKTLSHSFSGKYFSEKFNREGLDDHFYRMFELSDISEIQEVLSMKGMSGLNVTLPYKTQVIAYLDQLDERAQRIGAVNVIAFHDGRRVGFNSDYLGFTKSLSEWMGNDLKGSEALVLGTGGASKAVQVALEDLNIPFQLVSRSQDPGKMMYEEVTGDVLAAHRLIINTTPLGMHPHNKTCPPLPYHLLSGNHYLYDLVYNPETTLFMQKGQENNAHVMNGLRMLHLQAEAAWEIWNQ